MDIGAQTFIGLLSARWDGVESFMESACPMVSTRFLGVALYCTEGHYCWAESSADQYMALNAIPILSIGTLKSRRRPKCSQGCRTSQRLVANSVHSAWTSKANVRNTVSRTAREDMHKIFADEPYWLITSSHLRPPRVPLQ